MCVHVETTLLFNTQIILWQCGKWKSRRGTSVSRILGFRF